MSLHSTSVPDTWWFLVLSWASKKLVAPVSSIKEALIEEILEEVELDELMFSEEGVKELLGFSELVTLEELLLFSPLEILLEVPLELPKFKDILKLQEDIRGNKTNIFHDFFIII